MFVAEPLETQPQGYLVLADIGGDVLKYSGQ